MYDYAIPEMVNTIISTLLLPLVGIITKYAIEFFKSKAEEAKARTGNENLKHYIDIAEDAVATAVTVVSQTYVDTLRKQGAFDEKAQQQAFEMAKQKALTIMGETTQSIIGTLYNDFNLWIDNKLEYHVNISKK